MNWSAFNQVSFFLGTLLILGLFTFIPGRLMWMLFRVKKRLSTVASRDWADYS